MKNQDWKLKYQDLKVRFQDCLDVSFRLGYENGLQSAQVQQAQQQQADAQAQQAAMAGQPGQDPNADPSQEGQMPGQESPNGSELDSHISQLESMLGKTETGSLEYMNLKKSLDGIKSFQSNLKKAHDHKVSEMTLKSIQKAMQPKFTLGKTATKNLSESGKKALNMQEQIVADLLKSMAEEEQKTSESITKTLNFEQLLKN
jgi:RNA-binding protein YhbY